MTIYPIQRSRKTGLKSEIRRMVNQRAIHLDAVASLEQEIKLASRQLAQEENILLRPSLEQTIKRFS